VAEHDYRSTTGDRTATTGTVTVAAGQRTGTIDTDLLNTNPKAATGPGADIHVSGDWQCR